MYNRKNIIKLFAWKIGLILTIILLNNKDAFSQNITGPTCISPGNQYSYTLSEYDYNTNSHNFSYSITGGTLSTGGTTGSLSGSGQGYVTIYVTWQYGNISRSVSLTSSMGNRTLTVYASSSLTGGSMTSGQYQYLNYNTIPQAISCTASTGGPCSTPNYEYQWQESSNNVNFTNITGATSQNLTFTVPLTQTTYYRRYVYESTGGTSTYSPTAVVTVYPVLVAGNISPASQTINYNSNAALLTLSGVSGGTNSYAYQWQSSYDQTTFGNISGATSSTYTPTSLTTTTYYRVSVTSNGETLYTDPVSVFVNPQLLPGVISPEYVTITSGTSPGILTGTAASYGSCGNSYSYQWYSSTNGTSFASISGATSQYYTPGSLSVNTWFMRKATCSGASMNSDTVLVTIASGTPDVNFIRVRDITKPGVLDSAAAQALSNPADVKQTTQYFDGLGRPVQTVAMKQSPLQKDLVSINIYDDLGRENLKYLPYVSTTDDGNYKVGALADGLNYNAGQYPGENYYYSQKDFEPSPLNRVSSTDAAGNSWVGSGRGVSAEYFMNTAADSVRYWKIAFSPGSLPTTTTTYAPGTLYKNITTDEAGHSIVEYKDIQGKVVLKKVQLAASPGSAHVGWLCTYYIYDDLNNLRFVIQPKGVQLINSNWVVTTAIANELCFRYEYDYRKRMIIKKIPGAGEVWMVYDNRDRLVMSQDSSLRYQHKWMYIRYDSENRPDSTGLITDPSHYNDRVYHQNLATNSTNYPVVASYTNELLTQTFYDDYNWVSASGSGLSAAMLTNYTSNSTYFITGYNTSPVYSQPVTQFKVTRGMVTGTKAKVIGTTNQFLYAVNFYDDRGRKIETQSVNYTGGKDTSIVQYSFDGKPLRSLLLQRKSGTNAQSHKILTKMNYDAGGRLLTTYKNIDNAASDQLIATNTYNELGQLSNKELGDNMENLAYDYNVRGWLTDINKDYIAGTATHYFGMELGYDKTTSAASGNSYTTPQYNGNIEGTVWKSKGDGINRKYDFTYDNANRLTAASFLQNTTGSAWDNSYIDFSVSNLSYDANGNIMSADRNGFAINGSSPIDELTYTYETNSNKLQKVVDNIPTNNKLGDFNDGSSGTGTDYSYDGNGNLTLDNNKAISSITYNYLNLPNQVSVTSKGTIAYTYDAAGNKLKKVTTDNTVTPSKTTTTLYMGNLTYQNDTLQFISHEEGRARWALHHYLNGTSAYGFEYDYFIKDHLGNARMVLTQQKDTTQYIATMEAAYRTTEDQLFYNIPQSSYPRSAVSGYPTDNTTNPNDSLARVNGNGPKTGPALLLKVMGGDKVDIATKSFYKSGGTVSSPNSSLTDIMNALAGGLVTETSGTHGGITDFTNSSTPTYFDVNSFLSNNESNLSGKPKAYLNWILLDDQFKAVTTYPQSGAIPVGSADVLNTLAYSGIPITKNGYLYIWVSNETPGWDVFFDNLSVKHYSGPITQETHYYPFGLTMAGISDKAAGVLENKYKYNGKELEHDEFSDGSGLEEYDYGARMQDPQLGVWHNIDPLADKMRRFSPYTYGFDNPILIVDPDGEEGVKSVDKDGNKTIESNVVVLLRQKKTIPKNASGKKRKRLEKKNQRIERDNAATLKDVSEKLNDAYNGSDGKGTKNSEGEYVKFKFNIKGLETSDTKGGSLPNIRKIATENGIVTSKKDSRGNNIIALAAVVTTRSTQGSLGLSNGIYTTVSPSAPSIALAHEIGHTFQLPDNWPNSTGGIMDYPPGELIGSEVDEIWNKAHEK